MDLAKTHRQDLFFSLLENGQIKKSEHKKILKKAEQIASPNFYNYLLSFVQINEKELLKLFSKHYQLPIVNLAKSKVSEALLKQIPEELCLEHLMIPLAIEGDLLLLGMADPGNIEALDHAKFYFRSKVEVVLLPGGQIKQFFLKEKLL